MIISYVLLQVFETLWIEVIRQYTAAFLSSGKRKRPNTREDVSDNVFDCKHVDKPGVLRVQS